MANENINKIVLSTGEVLLDLTQDDVKAEHVDKGIKFHDKTGAELTGTSTKTVDASGATVEAAEILAGRTAGKGSSLIVGTMPDNSGKNVEISTTAPVTIPEGYTDGGAVAKISDTELAKIIPANIKADVQILGITGGYGGNSFAEELVFALANGTRIELSSVADIIIPEGIVQNIICGDKILWTRPAKYKTELEYLECTGTQYIDAGVATPLTVEAKIQGTVATSRSSIVLSMGSSAGAGDWFGFTSVWTLGGGINFGNAYNEIVTASCNFSGSELTVTIGDATKTRSGSTSGTLCIGSSASAYPASCRIFSVKIYNDSGEVVHDLIPVLDWDDRPCMYDRVTDELFYNQGSGEFLYNARQIKA